MSVKVLPAAEFTSALTAEQVTELNPDPFHGLLGPLAEFTRALTAGEVAAMYRTYTGTAFAPAPMPHPTRLSVKPRSYRLRVKGAPLP